MPSPLFADKTAPQSPDRGAVEALISRALRLRGDVAAVCGAPGEEDDGAVGRWQRALCDLAVHQLDDLGAQLDQLRTGRPAAGGRTDGGTGPFTGRVGSAEWNLLTDEVTWSDELFAILGRPRRNGPLTLDELPSLVLPEDRGVLASLVTACLIDGAPIDGEFRVVQGDGQVRTVHMMGQSVLDAAGCTICLWAVVRDVSALRRSERALRETGRSLGGEAPSTASEAGGRATPVVPLPRTTGVLRGGAGRPAAALELASCAPSESADGPLGGAWQDVFALPGGDGLLATGDLTGHAAAAATGLAAVRGAVRGMALAGIRPGPLLGHLNQLLDTQEQPMLGSALVGRYQPATRTFAWAQAGHPAPLLFRDGTARALTPPDGALLGAAPGSCYEQAEVRLLPGDVLVLYTDGLGGGTPVSSRVTADVAHAIGGTPTARGCAEVFLRECAGGACDDAAVLVARA